MAMNEANRLMKRLVDAYRWTCNYIQTYGFNWCGDIDSTVRAYSKIYSRTPVACHVYAGIAMALLQKQGYNCRGIVGVAVGSMKQLGTETYTGGLQPNHAWVQLENGTIVDNRGGKLLYLEEVSYFYG